MSRPLEIVKCIFIATQTWLNVVLPSVIMHNKATLKKPGIHSRQMLHHYERQWHWSLSVQRHQATHHFSYFFYPLNTFLKTVCQCHFTVVLVNVWLVFGLLRHVVKPSMRFLFWLHQDLSDLCRTSNERYTIGFTRSQLLCLHRESCGHATWPQQQLWIFYILRRGERGRETVKGNEREWLWVLKQRTKCGFGRGA